MLVTFARRLFALALVVCVLYLQSASANGASVLEPRSLEEAEELYGQLASLVSESQMPGMPGI